MVTMAPASVSAQVASTQMMPKPDRRLLGYTQGPGEPCDDSSYCKAGLKCSNAGVFGAGKCVSKASNLRANNARKLLLWNGSALFKHNFRADRKLMGRSASHWAPAAAPAAAFKRFAQQLLKHRDHEDEPRVA